MDQQTPSFVRHVRIGDEAPDFLARSTLGNVQLSQYRGRWLVFFTHPADFTPVCSSEFVALAKRHSEFEALDCALLGLSVDSLYAHLAWVRALKDAFGVTIPFPIVEDPSMVIGRAYGMIDDSSTDSTTMRSSFFIDPEGTIRAITCYPHNVGRSVDEMLRLLRALQTVYEGGVLTPEGWLDGDPVLALPATDAENMSAGADWFCRKMGK